MTPADESELRALAARAFSSRGTAEFPDAIEALVVWHEMLPLRKLDEEGLRLLRDRLTLVRDAEQIVAVERAARLAALLRETDPEVRDREVPRAA